MIASRPTILEYCRAKAASEELASMEWYMENPVGHMVRYRAGSSNAYFDIARKIENGEFKV